MARPTAAAKGSRRQQQQQVPPSQHSRTSSIDSTHTNSAAAGSATSHRPGTSGTENILMSTRLAAATQYKKAERAEKEYVTRKRAAKGRQELRESKEHWGNVFHHLGQALKKGASGILAVQYIVGEKRNSMKAKKDQREAKKAMEQKKKLEEKLRKQEELAARHAQESGEESVIEEN